MTCYRHACWEGIATIYTEPPDQDAWCWDGEKWVEVDRSEVKHKATAISEQVFREIFGDALPLPPSNPPSKAIGSMVIPEDWIDVTAEAVAAGEIIPRLPSRPRINASGSDVGFLGYHRHPKPR